MPTPRHTGAHRRDAIALAARGLIVEKGIEGLRTRDVAARVEINIATFHYHVPTKEAVVALVADSAAAAFAELLPKGAAEGAPPLVRLRAELAAFAAIVEDHPELTSVLAEIDQRATREPALRAPLERVRVRWLGNLVNILAQGKRDGSFRDDLDPPAAGAMMVAALTGASRIPGTGAAFIAAICAELERAVGVRDV